MSSTSSDYSSDFKSQVLKECFETGKYSTVAKKYGIDSKIIYTWIRAEKNRGKNKSLKSLEKETMELKLENEILRTLIDKNSLPLEERISVAKKFIDKGLPKTRVLKYSGVSSSTWYSQKNRVETDNRKNNKGRPVPGYSINTDGSIIPDEYIVSALKSYKSGDDNSKSPGVKKLCEYLLRDYNYRVNHKKIYRLCKENNLLSVKKKKT